MSVYIKENPVFLKESIESILNQTYKADQFILIKDGPLTTELDFLISQYEQNYPDLFTIVNLDVNIGLGAALNIGIRKSRNELVARMDSDDISMPERCLEEVRQFERDNTLAIVGTYIDEFSSNRDIVISSRYVPVKHDDIVRFCKRRSPFNHPTVMYKKSAVIGCGGYPATKRAEDFMLFSEMLNSGCKAMNIPKKLLLYRTNQENFKRRKNKETCIGNANVIYQNYKKGYSSFFDFLLVAAFQAMIFLLPVTVIKYITINFLRHKG